LIEDFRNALGLRYALMPYIYAQAKDSSARGFPMVRPMFFEYPNDPGSWTIDDQYMFGSDLLVAPMFASGTERRVYLPPGSWIDYQSGRVYEGRNWHDIPLGKIPVVLLVKNHSVLPHIKVAQSTKDMDWNNVELRVFSADKRESSTDKREGESALPGEIHGTRVTGLFTRPGSGLQTLVLVRRGRDFALREDLQAGKVKWTIKLFPLAR
jgi:alpha-D-xyloside xylohydrolase